MNQEVGIPSTSLFIGKINTIPLILMALQFHISSHAFHLFFFTLEANPDKFNNRFKNLVFYGKVSVRSYNIKI